jgi:hypothetical protein
VRHGPASAPELTVNLKSLACNAGADSSVRSSGTIVVCCGTSDPFWRREGFGRHSDLSTIVLSSTFRTPSLPAKWRYGRAIELKCGCRVWLACSPPHHYDVMSVHHRPPVCRSSGPLDATYFATPCSPLGYQPRVNTLHAACL